MVPFELIVDPEPPVLPDRPRSPDAPFMVMNHATWRRPGTPWVVRARDVPDVDVARCDSVGMAKNVADALNVATTFSGTIDRLRRADALRPFPILSEPELRDLGEAAVQAVHALELMELQPQHGKTAYVVIGRSIAQCLASLYEARHS